LGLEILEKMPLVKQMTAKAHDELSLKKFLAECSPSKDESNLCYQMLRFVVASQRTTIRFIPEFLPNTDAVAFFDPHPEKLVNFNKLKNKHGGSYYSFHGTKPECAYSVCRQELRDLSDSHLMTTGAAYGQGIYTTQSLSMASRYATPG